MNNNITESYCSFEVSKLLKEKGFDVYTIDTYNDSGQSTNRYSITVHDDMDEAELQKEFEVRNSEMVNDYISKPTHTLAIEWIRVNFGLFLYVHPYSKKYYHFTIIKDLQRENLTAYDESLYGGIGAGSGITFDTPQEATEAALLYVLTELI